MSGIEARYDRDADLYARCWHPVHASASFRLIAETAAEIDRAVARAGADGRVARVLDIGAGTGAVAIEIAARWPTLEVVASDLSSGMLEVARRGIEAAGVSGQVRIVHAGAADLGLEGESVDVAISSFVFQLVPDRGAALREALRVLRPRGLLSVVTWLDREESFPAADEFDEAVFDLGIEEPDEEEAEEGDEGAAVEAPSGDFGSGRAAATEFRRAGFRRVHAEETHFEYRWTLDSYLTYKREYGESALLSWLDADRAEALFARARERLSALPEDAFVWRAPVVFVRGRKPG